MRWANDATSPSFLVVPVGHKVRFENTDDLCHRFFSSSKPQVFDVGLLKPGEAKTQQFDRPGLVHIYCSLHEGKQATILVAPTPYFAFVTPEGGFEIHGVPTGRCELQTWSDDGVSVCSEVDVSPDAVNSVEIALDESQVQGT